MYLASKSPQRKALLEALGLDFEVILPDYEEVDEAGLLPAQLVEQHSRGKALAVAARVAPLVPGRPVLGVDTLVYAGGRALGKARDEATAREYLHYMSGKVHVVYSGITLVSALPEGGDPSGSALRMTGAEGPRMEGSGGQPEPKEAEPWEGGEAGGAGGHPERSGGVPGEGSQESHPERSGGVPGEGSQESHPERSGGVPGEGSQESHPERSGGVPGEGSQESHPERSEGSHPDEDIGPSMLTGEIESLGGRQVLIDTRHATTDVRFTRLSDAEIDAYIATGEWRERAGAYAIQGRASAFVEEIDGDYTNVVGLPVPLLVEMLRETGLWPPDSWRGAAV